MEAWFGDYYPEQFKQKDLEQEHWNKLYRQVPLAFWLDPRYWDKEEGWQGYK